MDVHGNQCEQREKEKGKQTIRFNPEPTKHKKRQTWTDGYAVKDLQRLAPVAILSAQCFTDSDCDKCCPGHHPNKCGNGACKCGP